MVLLLLGVVQDWAMVQVLECGKSHDSQIYGEYTLGWFVPENDV
jgi:hypothetical protein